MSLGSFPALYETGSSNTKAHMCSHLKICSHVPYTSFLSFFSLFLVLSKPPSFFHFFGWLIFACFSLSHCPHPSSLSLSHTHCVFYFNRLFLPFYLILSSPLRCSSLSFPQEEPQSYLGYVGFGELKSHFTNSLSASPENSSGYLKQFHHFPGFVHWNAAHQMTVHSLWPLNANPLPASPSSCLPLSSPVSFSPSASFLFLHGPKCLINTDWVSLVM